MNNKDVVNYELNKEEIKLFLSANYGIDSRSGNNSIGKEIVNVINSLSISKDRETFFAQKVKDVTIKNLSKNKRLGDAIKLGISDNFVHQMILYEIRLFLFYRKNPEFLKYRK